MPAISNSAQRRLWLKRTEVEGHPGAPVPQEGEIHRKNKARCAVLQGEGPIVRAGFPKGRWGNGDALAATLETGTGKGGAGCPGPFRLKPGWDFSLKLVS